MDFEGVKEFISTKLKDELPDYLTYHGLHHIEDVYNAADQLADMEGIGDYDKSLLLTAALFHDSGFIYCYTGHELKSCEIAKQYLPDYGYSEDEITRICGMIMATRIPQTPHNLLEEIIADADLDYLGRIDFFDIGKELYTELKYLGMVESVADWNIFQINFLNKHRYFTDSSKRIRKETKKQHILQLQSLLQTQ